MSRDTDLFAHDQLRAAGLLEPPVDIIGLAYRLGVTEITTADLVEDGRLDVTSTAIRILLRPDLGAARRRFTIAHEIAHLLIGPDSSFVARRFGTARDDTERTCDQIAAGLLLPYRWLQDSFTGRPHALRTIREVSESAEVSMGAALVRMKEVLNWDLSLLRWRHDDSKWRFVAGAGLPAGLYGAIRTTKETSCALDSLREGGLTDSSGQLPLMIRSMPRQVAAEVSVWRRTAMALVDLVEAAAPHECRP